MNISSTLRRFQRPLAVTAAGAALFLGWPAGAHAEEGARAEAAESEDDPAAIRGSVQDSHGIPIQGATIVATPLGASGALQDIAVVTDRRGTFLLSNLASAPYSVRVRMPGFTTVVRFVDVSSGSNRTEKFSLQAAPEAGRSAAIEKSPSINIVDILNRDPWKRPTLHFKPLDDSRPPMFVALDGLSGRLGLGSDYSGTLQIFTHSIQTAEGISEGVGTQFSVTTLMTPDAKITLHGFFSELALVTNGFEANVDFRSSESRQSHIGIALRQVALPGMPRTPFSFAREVKFHYGDQLRWTRNVALDYDAEVGSLDAYSDGVYFRPRMGMAWTAGANTTVRFGVTRQDPAGTANRWRDGFDNTVFWPYAKGESFHGEVAVAHLSRSMTVTFAAFNDRSATQSLFALNPSGNRKLLVFDGQPMSTGGMRVEFNRDFESFSAGAAYTDATGIGLGGGRIWTFNDLVRLLRTQRFHMLTTRFHTRVQLTNTEVTAVYRFVSGIPGLPIDPYQTFAESNEPTLSVMVAQELPGFRPFGGRVQAILDARNIFEPSLNISPRYQLAQAPRLVKGGVNIRF